MNRVTLIIFAIAWAAALSFGLATAATAAEPITSSGSESVSASMSLVEKRVREAAVQIVFATGGHGSGSLIKYKDLHLVITAQHVADGSLGKVYHVQKRDEIKRGVLVYSDEAHDIAILLITPSNRFVGIKPIKYNPLKDIAEVGTKIIYSGYPSHHSTLSFRGEIVGNEVVNGAGTMLMIDVFGWFGSSGSVVYNTDGQIVGILWGVDVERRRNNQVNENMVWVSPIQNLDIDLAIKALCNGLNKPPKACR